MHGQAGGNPFGQPERFAVRVVVQVEAALYPPVRQGALVARCVYELHVNYAALRTGEGHQQVTGLIEALEFEHEGEMIRAVSTGRAWVNAHGTAFTQYAEEQWNAAMHTLSPTLIRGIILKLMSLHLKDTSCQTNSLHEEPAVILAREVGKRLVDLAERTRSWI
ncbi:hypothetical protein SRABI13_02795 [Erwinia aphidicola]|nr:hypothetical protein SRABI13_02795 [Erwinia aphidicola]